mgnify:CR=1 FL=1
MKWIKNLIIGVGLFLTVAVSTSYNTTELNLIQKLNHEIYRRDSLIDRMMPIVELTDSIMRRNKALELSFDLLYKASEHKKHYIDK